MKKLILAVFIFCSVFASAQISIPQVTGLPAALNSKVDKVSGKSLVADTLSAKIQPHVTNLSNPHSVTKAQVGLGNVDNTSDVNKPISTATQAALNAKQEILVSGTNIRTVNGNSVLGSGDIQIVAGGGGSPTNIYLSNVASSISGYKNASPTIDVTETVKTITATPANTITWGEKYLYISPVATTIIPSGFWELHAYGHVNTSTGVSNLVFRIIRYSGSTETFLGTITSFEVNNTTDGEIFSNGSLGDITILAGDYLGIQVGFLSDGTSPARTLTYTIGNGHATHFNTPLPTRHSSLRDKNGEVDYQHLTAAQVTKVNNTSGTNTGDETLTSIKTKLGAASAVSDGYLTSNMFNVFNNSEPAFSKNTGFNLPIGTTTGTVLEGRTFGTAASSSIVDFIQNQNSSAQTANMWVNSCTSSGSISSQYGQGAKTGTLFTNSEGVLDIQYWGDNANNIRASIGDINNSIAGTALKLIGIQGRNEMVELALMQNVGLLRNYGTTLTTQPTTSDFQIALRNNNVEKVAVNISNIDNSVLFTPSNGGYVGIKTGTDSPRFTFYNNNSVTEWALYQTQAGFGDDFSISKKFGTSYTPVFNLAISGEATFSSTVNSTGFLLNGNNLTSSLSTNYIPKWNGSSMVNSLISEDGSGIFTSGSFHFANSNPHFVGSNKFFASGSGVNYLFTGGGSGIIIQNQADNATNLILSNTGNMTLPSTTASTSPTTGALVVGGGIGVGGKINVGSTEQSDMDGTTINAGSISTNGGMSAAKDINAGGNINAHGDISAYGIITSEGQQLTPIYQNQTSVGGSVAGIAVCSMPIRTGVYKKVLIKLDGFNGTANYTYPIPFTNQALALMTAGLSIGSANTNNNNYVTITSAAVVYGTIIIEGY